MTKYGAPLMIERTILAKLFLGLSVVLSLHLFPAAGAADPVFSSKDLRYKVVALADRLDKPWGMAFLPGDEGILITEKTGKVRHYRGGLLSDAVGGGPKAVAWGQGGLLDIAIHPDFKRNRLVYFSYAGPGPGGVGLELARARFTGRAFEKLEVLFKARPKTQAAVHFGSRLVFDRTGHLFMTYGDRGDRHEAQNLKVHNGSIFRFTAEGRIPKDNPFVGRTGALPEIYTYGNRNVQGAALHPKTGILWTHEHGPQGGDEINIIRKGANYGWPAITYGEEYGGGPVSDHTSLPGMEQPVLHWTPSIAPSGMAFYTGNKFPEWKGNIFVGALVKRHLRRVILSGEKAVGQEKLLVELNARIRDVENGPDGYLYVLTDSTNGRLLRLEPVGNGNR